MKLKKKEIVVILGLTILLLIMAGSLTYSMFRFTGTGTKDNVITTGKISVNYSESKLIDLTNQYPVSDETGIAQTAEGSQLKFTITANFSNNVPINYAIALDQITEGATLKENFIKIYLLKGSSVANTFVAGTGKLISSVKPKKVVDNNSNTLISNYAIYSDTFTTSGSQEYTLKAWISDQYNLPQVDSSTTTTHRVETTSETVSFKIKVIAIDQAITIQ